MAESTLLDSRQVVSGAHHVALLEEISKSASQIALLADKVCDGSGEPDELDAMTSAIALLARRTGWFSDVALAGLRGQENGPSDAHYWLMPKHCIPQAPAKSGMA